MENNQSQDITKWKLPEGAITRLGKGYTFDFEYSPDGKRLAVASTLGVWLYDTYTNKELFLLTGHTDYTTTALFSPDGETLVSENYDYEISSPVIKLWDVSTGELKANLTGHKGEVNHMVFHPNGKTLAITSKESNIQLWDMTKSDPESKIIENTANVKLIAYSPDGKKLACAGDEIVRLWRTETHEFQLTFAAHANSIDSLKYSPDGKMIATRGNTNTVCLWDANTGENLHRFKTGKNDVSSLDFSSDGNTIACVSYDGIIKLWNSHTGEEIKTHDWKIKLYGVQSSPDGKLFACDDDNGTMILFDAKTGEIIHNLKMPEDKICANDYRFTQDGQTLAVSNGFDIYFWNIETGEWQESITGYAEVVRLVLYTPDEETVVSLDSVVRIWDVNTEKLLKTLSLNRSIGIVTYSPDGKTLACGTYDNTIVLWNVRKWEKSTILEGHTDSITSLAYSPDGKMIASGSADRTIKLWNAQTGEQKQTLIGHTSGIDILFYPNGKKLVSCDDNTIRTWCIDTGKVLNSIEMDVELIYSLAIAPDGKTYASGDDKHEIRIWDAATGELLKTIKKKAATNFLAFSPDGKVLASAGYERIYFWNPTTGELIKTLKGHIGPVNSIAFSSDGEKLVSGGRDSTVIFWDLTE